MVVKVKFSDKDRGWANWARALRTLGGPQSEVEIGLIEGVTPDNVIAKGAINELGSAGSGVRSTDLQAPIPARPWFRTTVDKNADKYLKLMAKLFIEEMEKGLRGGDVRIKEAVAKRVVTDLKIAIQDWSEPPNSPYTEAKKGFNDPLVETGELQNAPTYRITPGKKR